MSRPSGAARSTAAGERRPNAAALRAPLGNTGRMERDLEESDIVTRKQYRGVLACGKAALTAVPLQRAADAGRARRHSRRSKRQDLMCRHPEVNHAEPSGEPRQPLEGAPRKTRVLRAGDLRAAVGTSGAERRSADCRLARRSLGIALWGVFAARRRDLASLYAGFVILRVANPAECMRFGSG